MKTHTSVVPGSSIVRKRLPQESNLAVAKYLGKIAKPRAAPVDTGRDGATKFMAMKGATTQAERDAMAGKDFMGLLGSLRYIVDQTRPDCAFHVSFLGQFMHNPSIVEYDAALEVLSYLHKTRPLRSAH